MESRQSDWDVFISYASENRQAVAEPIAKFLDGVGLDVWYDQTALEVGDSLREKLNEGLSRCRYGLVILSPEFFKKYHTKRELSALTQRETDEGKVILPVWYDVTVDDVREHSLALADRIAAKWDEGCPSVMVKILRVVAPDILEQIESEMSSTRLRRIKSGSQLGGVIGYSHISLFHNEEPDTEQERELIAQFIQSVRDWGDIWSMMEPGEHIRAEGSMDDALEELENRGWYVYGAKEKRREEVMGVMDDWIWSILALLKGEPQEVVSMGRQLFVARAKEGA